MTKININNFKRILMRSQEVLHGFLYGFLKKNGYENVVNENKFLYAEGEIPVLLVAHLDTVHRYQPHDIFFDEAQSVMWSPQGIGGDDRCGVFSIMTLIEMGFRPHILFCRDEEIGGIGAECATRAIFPAVNFIIELDRRGGNDAVFYECGNQDFKDYILSFGFEENYGSFSDISILSPDWDVASVNLSIGYYNEHTMSEFISVVQMEEVIDRVAEILMDNQSIYYDFQMIEIRRCYHNNFDYMNGIDWEEIYK